MNQYLPYAIALLLLVIVFLLVKILSQLKYMSGIAYKTLNNTSEIDNINKNTNKINERIVPLDEKLNNIQNILSANRSDKLGRHQIDEDC